MFYCNKCADRYKYPESISKSVGKCECCGTKTECNDRPSSSLPNPNLETKDDIEDIIIFLDIDGVIATSKSIDEVWVEYMGISPNDCSFSEVLTEKNLPMPHTCMFDWPFDRRCISNIHKLQLFFHEKGKIVNYVISSSWRLSRSLEELQELFVLKGLHLTNIIGKTKYLDATRGKEILTWLEDNKKTSPYLVIDDDIMYDIFEDISEGFTIETKFKDGFTNKLLEEAIEKIEKQLI